MRWILTFALLALATLPTQALTQKELEQVELVPSWQFLPWFKDADYIYTIHAKAQGLQIGQEGTSNTIPIEWEVPRTEVDVLFGKLRRLRKGEHKDDQLLDQLGARHANYKGIFLDFKTKPKVKAGDTHVPNMIVFNGFVRDSNGNPIFPDPGRQLEYWLWGTSKTRIHQRMALEALHVFNFNQCLLMGNLIVETEPRQCLMADETVMLEVPDRPSLEEARIKDFEECLDKGRAIIDSFPRRCVAAGGKLFAEPPRLPDGRTIDPSPTN